MCVCSTSRFHVDDGPDVEAQATKHQKAGERGERKGTTKNAQIIMLLARYVVLRFQGLSSAEWQSGSVCADAPVAAYLH